MTSASKLLHITHSGLSKSMKLLQEELGLSLLRPSGRGLSLTDEGALIYKRAKEFLERESELFKIEKKPVKNTLRIGTVELFLTSISEQLKHHSFENSIVTLLDLEPGEIEQLIANRQLDFGITYAPFPTDRVDITEIGRFRLACYHLRGSFEGKKISEIPFVTPAKGLSSNPLQIKERDGWLDSIYPREIKYSVNLLSTGIELTLQGLCAIYIPEFVAQKINASRRSGERLVEYPLDNQNHYQTAFLLSHKDTTEDGLFKQLFRMTKESMRRKSNSS